MVNTRGSNSVAVAEHAMLLVLACAKTLNVLQDRYRAGQFKEARKLAAVWRSRERRSAFSASVKSGAASLRWRTTALV